MTSQAIGMAPFPAERGGRLERLEAPPREDDRPAVVGQGDGDRGADAAAGSGDECDPRHDRPPSPLMRNAFQAADHTAVPRRGRRSAVSRSRRRNCESPGQEGVPGLSPVSGDGSSASCPSLDPISSSLPASWTARVESQLRISWEPAARFSAARGCAARRTASSPGGAWPRSAAAVAAASRSTRGGRRPRARGSAARTRARRPRVASTTRPVVQSSTEMSS